MKKRGYCSNCKLEFDYNIEEYSNVLCPKCKNKVDGNSKKTIIVSKVDIIFGKIFNSIFNIYYYYFLIIGLLGLLLYFLNFTKAFHIVSIIGMVCLALNLLNGFLKGIVGFVLMIIATVVCNSIVGVLEESIFLGSCIALTGTCLLKILFVHLLLIIEKKMTKKA